MWPLGPESSRSIAHSKIFPSLKSLFLSPSSKLLRHASRSAYSPVLVTG